MTFFAKYIQLKHDKMSTTIHDSSSIGAILSIITWVFGYFVPMIIGVPADILSWFQLLAFITSIGASSIVIYKFFNKNKNA